MQQQQPHSPSLPLLITYLFLFFPASLFPPLNEQAVKEENNFTAAAAAIIYCNFLLYNQFVVDFTVGLVRLLLLLLQCV